MSESRTYYYARVSSKDQNLSRQFEAFYKIGATDRYIITDKESGKNLNRNGYLALRNTLLRDGDTLVIKSLDRLSRKKEDITNELQYYQNRNIRVKILDLPTTMIEIPENQSWVISMVNNILIEVLGTIAEQERITIKSRQKEGIDAAKKNGVKFGRPKAIKPSNWNAVINQWQHGEITAVKAMATLNLKRSTFYKFLAEETK